MNIPASAGERHRDHSQDLDNARALAELGVPVFTCGLTPDGEPRGAVRWERTESGDPSFRAIDRWRPGMGLCAVTGVVLDVIDFDPRNGAKESVPVLADLLGREGIGEYWRVRTPSRGWHYWIPALGIGTKPGFMPGIDLKGGLPDGTSRGFVFLPPTARPSKHQADAAVYERLPRGRRPPVRAYVPDGDAPLDIPRGKALSAHRDRLLNALESASGISVPDDAAGLPAFGGAPVRLSGRRPIGELRAACLTAPDGGQRTALMALALEYHRRPMPWAEIRPLLEDVMKEMPAYDPRKPWTERHIDSLRPKRGTQGAMPDATPAEAETLGEIAMLSGPRPLVRSLEGMIAERVSWLWTGYLAFRELTQMDGGKGEGKTFVTDDIAARASRGLPMPGQDRAACGPVNVLIFTDEGHAQTTLVPRLQAAGADMSRIFIPSIAMTTIDGKVARRGERIAPPTMLLPEGAKLMGMMISEAKAGLAIWDPITDFFGSNTNTNNDASVRQAIGPLGHELQKHMCAGWMLRHTNKDTQASARNRGGGSKAFQNRARVHLVTGRLPLVAAGIDGPKFGIAMVDNNVMPKIGGTLAYSITNSAIQADDQGNMIGKVDWAGYVDVDEDTLVQGESQHGPEATTQAEVAELVRGMFAGKDTIRSTEADLQVKEAGFSVSKATMAKILRSLGVSRRMVSRRGGGASYWVWTTVPGRYRPGRSGNSNPLD